MSQQATFAALAAIPLIIGDLGTAVAQPTNDGFCDLVEGVADADSALLFAPQVFGQVGRIEQSSASSQPTGAPGTVRFIGGLRWSLSGIYEGVHTRARARAECKRHLALEQIRGETLFRAFEARANVIDKALPEAEKMLVRVAADLAARRTTAQEAMAIRLRVDELRRISTDAHAAMSVLPSPSNGGLGLVAYQNADDEMAQHDARIRRARGIDVNVRVGVDEFLDGNVNADTSSPYFAVLSVSVNLGVLFQTGANDRALDGRRRLVREDRNPVSVDASGDRAHAELDVASRRSRETAALEADLQKQIDVLDRVGGDDSQRYRQTVWFDLIKIRAERAFFEARVAALERVLRSK